jgi:DNA-binding CsgD family transcriptional regulator
MTAASRNSAPPAALRIASEPLARAILNSLSAHIAILDEAGVILETNQAWENYALDNGVTEESRFIGTNYLSVCEAAGGPDAVDGRKVARGIRAVIEGRTDLFLHDYPCHSPLGRHWYYLRAIRMAGQGPLRVVVSHEDITALKLSEEALRESQEALKKQKQHLQEANIALRVLLDQRERDKRELEDKVLHNVKNTVLPYVEKLQRLNLKPETRQLVDFIASHLNDIISPFVQHFSSAGILLTPQEIQVAALIKDGKSSKEIADRLKVSETTVHFHRKNLRRKFGLKEKQANLRVFLMNLK